MAHSFSNRVQPNPGTSRAEYKEQLEDAAAYKGSRTGAALMISATLGFVVGSVTAVLTGEMVLLPVIVGLFAIVGHIVLRPQISRR